MRQFDKIPFNEKVIIYALYKNVSREVVRFLLDFLTI